MLNGPLMAHEYLGAAALAVTPPRRVGPRLPGVAATAPCSGGLVSALAASSPSPQLQGEPLVGPGWPDVGETFPGRECLPVVLSEEWWHRVYAEHDLAVLEEQDLPRGARPCRPGDRSAWAVGVAQPTRMLHAVRLRPSGHADGAGVMRVRHRGLACWDAVFPDWAKRSVGVRRQRLLAARLDAWWHCRARPARGLGRRLLRTGGASTQARPQTPSPGAPVRRSA